MLCQIHKKLIFKKLCELEKTDKEKIKQYAEILYTSAALMEGIPPENPVDFPL